MPSLLHEGILELIRDRPAFVADLLRELLHVDVPEFAEARLADATLSQPLPVEYRADAVVLLVGERPVFGCIIEAQLAEDSSKAFSWPVYVTNARARYQCPFVLVVVTPSESVATWAARPLALGGGQSFHPLVVGPSGIPIITDAAAAIVDPALALLSALAHARNDSDTALSVARAAFEGVVSLPREQAVLYFHILQVAVSDAARKAFEMLPHYRLEKYLTDEERQRVRAAADEGRKRGIDEALVRMLERRGLPVSAELRARFASKSADELLELIDRSTVVTRAEDLLG